MNKLAENDFAVDLTEASSRGDEIGGIGKSLNEFRGQLQSAESGAIESTFKSAAFEGTTVALMMVWSATEIVVR
jgi:methyl-accepting chemotaxis protein